MSDTPHPDPLDEQASDLFDAGADAPGDAPDLGARLDEFRALRDALADVPPAPDAQRTGAIAAALSLFDELAADATSVTPAAAGEGTAEAAAQEPSVVTPIRSAAPSGASSGAGSPARHRRTLALLTAAASVVVVLGVVALVTRGSGRSGVDSPTAAVIGGDGDGGFSQAKAADQDAPAAAAESGSATAGGSDTTAAAAASTVAAAASTSVRAASSAAATTTAAPAGGFASAPPEEPTSTTDGRDTTTTAAAGTTSPPTTTSTNVDAGALPYLGELTSVDDLAAALGALPPFDGADAGAPIRAQLADGVCDLRPYGTPLAVLRWNGRDSVVLRSADAPIVQLIPLDGCNPIVQLDAPS